MAGALRKMGLYLGLVDDEAYEDYAEDDYLEPEVEEPAPRSTTVRRFDERLDPLRRAAAVGAVRRGVERVAMAPPPPVEEPAGPLPDHHAAPAQLQRGAHDRRALPRRARR